MDSVNDRLFEIPYNFDKSLIYLIDEIYLLNQNIYCFYLPPFRTDYPCIIRGGPDDNNLFINRQEYYQHIDLLNTFGDNKYQNKLQLLLQNTNKNFNMSRELLQDYIKLGFTKFCIGNIEQGLVIKELIPEAEIVGSITMHTTKEDIENNLELYKDIFSALVLDFSYCKNINKIKELPKEFKYIILVNSLCNIGCKGTPHWNLKNADGTKFTQDQCPGLLTSPSGKFETSCLIRPMDLQFFDPYIFAYKLQDRGWKTQHIIRDLVLYTTDWVYYPNIIYNENLYQQIK